MRKKSIKKARQGFNSEIDQIKEFLTTTGGLSAMNVSWVHDYAVIRLYRAFEDFVLTCLVATINNDSSQLSKSTGVNFPKHLSDEVCEFIIVGNGYFDFKGRADFIKTLKTFVADNHYLLIAIKNKKYKEVLEQLSALRNFAAHDSRPSKKRALEATGVHRMSSPGAWLKAQGRLDAITSKLGELAKEVADAAPY